jgi:hypothetical protein
VKSNWPEREGSNLIRAECSVFIGLPTEAVFDYLVNPEKATEWQAAVFEVRADSSDPMTVGSRIFESRRFLGQRLESTLEVTAFIRGKLFALKVISGPVTFEVTHTLVPAGGGTEMRIVLDGDPGAFFKLAEPLVQRVAQHELEDSYSALKEILEARRQ